MWALTGQDSREENNLSCCHPLCSPPILFIVCLLFSPLTVDRPSVGSLVRFEKPQWFRTKLNVQFAYSAVVAPIIYFYGCYWFTLGEEKKWICIWSVYPALEMMTSLSTPQGMFSWLYSSQLLTKSMHTVALFACYRNTEFYAQYAKIHNNIASPTMHITMWVLWICILSNMLKEKKSVIDLLSIVCWRYIFI